MLGISNRVCKFARFDWNKANISVWHNYGVAPGWSVVSPHERSGEGPAPAMLMLNSAPHGCPHSCPHICPHGCPHRSPHRCPHICPYNCPLGYPHRCPHNRTLVYPQYCPHRCPHICTHGYLTRPDASCSSDARHTRPDAPSLRVGYDRLSLAHA